MSEEWGPWIEHDGNGCPCEGKWVQAQTMRPNGTIQEGEGIPCLNDPRSRKCWNGGGMCMGIYCEPVIRYRIRRPRALLQLIEMVENLPAPAQPRVDA